jgi:fructose-specific PTS system IIA-like component
VRQRTKQQLTSSTELGKAILNAHLAILDDVLLAQRLAEYVSRGKSAGYAIVESGKYFTASLRQSANEYLRERAADIEGILLQIMEEFYGSTVPENIAQEKLQEDTILVAETLGPQQLLALNCQHLKGIVLENSGATSHAVLVAQSLGIPTVVGVRNACALFSGVSDAVVDGLRGFVISPVTPAIERFYERELEVYSQRQALFATRASAPALTRDHEHLEIAANASSLEEVVIAVQNGAEGIGLFRTEIGLLQQKEFPSEQHLFSIYADVVRGARGYPVLFRTLDVGGDKKVPFLELPTENNPFLGYRGVRIYSEHRDFLHTQLRAILRASVYGRVQIMAPMVSTLDEIRAFHAEVAEATENLQGRNIEVAEHIPVGIMIEVPSAAFILDQLCSEVDFFSIGTNDLAQYFLAVDRENFKVAPLFNVVHPGFIRLLRTIVTEVHKFGKWVGMCGDMAAEPRNMPLLLGLGLDEISVPAQKIPELKDALRGLLPKQCEELVDRLSGRRESHEVQTLLESFQAAGSAPLLLSEDMIELKSESRSKEEAIQELVDLLYVGSRCNDRQELEEAVWAREAVYSTGLGFGFATPHCKSDAVKSNSIGVLKLKDAVDWGAADQEPVRMVILIAMREQSSASDHMQVFSELARKLMNEEFRERLLSFDGVAAMARYLREELSL